MPLYWSHVATVNKLNLSGTGIWFSNSANELSPWYVCIQTDLNLQRFKILLLIMVRRWCWHLNLYRTVPVNGVLDYNSSVLQNICVCLFYWDEIHITCHAKSKLLNSTLYIHVLCNCHFYRAMHFSAKCGIVIACRLSVCPSVTLVNCDHIGWNSSKIITPLVSLGRSLFATQHDGSAPRGTPPKFGPKVTHPLLIWALETFDCKLRPNGYT